MYPTDKALKLMKVAPVRLANEIEKLSTLQQSEMALELERIMERAALVAGYVGGRVAGGKHESAVKRANRYCTGARKIIGYTQPKSDLSF